MTSLTAHKLLSEDYIQSRASGCIYGLSVRRYRDINTILKGESLLDNMTRKN